MTRLLACVMIAGTLTACNNHEALISERDSDTNYPLVNSISTTIVNDTIYYQDKRFTGKLYELYPNSTDTILLATFSDGVLSGDFTKWYPRKKLMETRTYRSGKKHGSQAAFWQNGNKRFAFVARDDVYEGEMKEWNSEGKLLHLATYKHGQEEGTQKLWYDNGKIRANYVVLSGKRYGLLGTKNCKNVSDSIFN